MLRFVFVLLSWVLAYFWSDWRNWRKYHATILFTIVGSLLYNFLCADYPMWLLHTEVANHTINDLILTFGFTPAAILVFLTHFPYASSYLKRTWAVFLATCAYSVIEYIELLLKNIHYYNGWNFEWSVIFNVISFTVIALHYKRPLWAYLVSIVVVVTLLCIFHVPVA